MVKRWEEQKDRPYELGLVLAGGGIRGMAHLGVLRALEEAGVKISCISGTSAGAMVGALYAAGYAPEEILGLFQENNFFPLANLSIWKAGLFDSDRYAAQLEKYLDKRQFEDLPIRLFVTATDLQKGECRTFQTGPLARAIMASAAVPGLFSPVEIEGVLYVDGGCLNNFPVEPLEDCCSRILGVSVNPLQPMEKEEFTGVLKVLERIYQLSTRYPTFQKSDKCDWVLRPDELLDFSIFDRKKAEHAFQVGYRAAQEVIDQVASALIR